MLDARSEAIQDVVSAYAGQLQHGCSDSGCDEILCATGRRNLAQRPLRNYTARSARIAALSIASGPNPRAHLCPRYRKTEPVAMEEEAAEKEGGPPSKTPRDPSSLEQLLSDTRTVRNAASHRLHLVSVGLTAWRHSLGDLLRSRRSNQDMVHVLIQCLSWLISTIPPDARQKIAGRVSEVFGDTRSAASHVRILKPEFRAHAVVFYEHIDHEPSFHLFVLILEVLKAHAGAVSVFADNLVRSSREEQSRDEHFVAVIWLKKTFLQFWNGDPCLGQYTTANIALLLLEMLHVQQPGLSCKGHFLIPAIGQAIDPLEMVRSFRESQQRSDSARHILKTNSSFTVSDKAFYFRYLNHLRMRDAHATASVNHDLFSRSRHHRGDETVSTEAQLNFLQEHYLLLTVSRADVLEDAFDQLWHRRRSELLRPLRVRLGEMDEYEVGQDLGGVQLEFFNLVCKKVFEEHLAIFTTDTSTGFSYFRTGSLQPLHKFELCGILFGLALYNGLTIPVNFPIAFYSVLKGETISPHPDMIREGWPTIARALQSVLDGEVDLDAELPLEANGLRLSTLGMQPEDQSDKCVLRVVDATRMDNTNGTDPINLHILDWPGWEMVWAEDEAPKIDDTNKQDFVQSYIRWIIVDSVLPQYRAFKAGFFTVIEPVSLRMLSAHDLCDIMEGSKELDIAELRAATVYDEPYKDEPEYIQHFWHLVSNWPPEKQKKLVKFVTAAERIPAAGASSLTFKIQGPMHESIDALPTSSTCFGVLTLPEYPDIETLDQKLTLALEFGLEGFGTG